MRDGLFYEMLNPDKPQLNNVLEESIHNMLQLHPGGVLEHVKQVNKLALQLFDFLAPILTLPARYRSYVHAASLLYRIGSSINYYQFTKHTQYMIAQARIDGLSHREIVLCSLIASHKTKSRTHQLASTYKDILEESDETVVNQLGTLVQLAAGLDRSETQPIQDIVIAVEGKTMLLKLLCSHSAAAEMREIADFTKEFEKAWGLSLKAQAGVFSKM
ncbi:hypothetical protein [Paenibacillus hexagrammi]|uniref:Ppx/GppA phosphatase C-terminal domain-containing protein n=1 Tax=Paenibacillus hexagrammi TaxID=2908839 RepID=A0ABY3SP17_9BACL|nr:hypothetical protein [Paenibacillus sp. YPD9-1]UJF34737.1 hypothetical protein L0M14_06110 [Paenibacillus sp. YPD9-1]